MCCVEAQVKVVSPCPSFPVSQCHTLKLPLAGAHLHPFAHALRRLLFLVREQPLSASSCEFLVGNGSEGIYMRYIVACEWLVVVV